MKGLGYYCGYDGVEETTYHDVAEIVPLGMLSCSSQFIYYIRLS